MNAQTLTIIEECTRASDEERLSFPEIIGMLMSVDVERYRTDLCRSEKTYYLPDGASHVTASDPLNNTVSMTFSAQGVESAVRASQAGQIKYREFCKRIAAAGCVDYVVSLAGRRAIYYGRNGDAHVEMFPGGPD
jgi:uncharacterized protein YbcV (DUF1398 family)